MVASTTKHRIATCPPVETTGYYVLLHGEVSVYRQDTGGQPPHRQVEAVIEEHKAFPRASPFVQRNTYPKTLSATYIQRQRDSRERERERERDSARRVAAFGSPPRAHRFRKARVPASPLSLAALGPTTVSRALFSHATLGEEKKTGRAARVPRGGFARRRVLRRGGVFGTLLGPHCHHRRARLSASNKSID